jgi:hypothetical protein
VGFGIQGFGIWLRVKILVGIGLGPDGAQNSGSSGVEQCCRLGKFRVG